MGSGRQPAMRIATKRIYEAAAAEDGARVLVDGMWPRGVSKQAAALDAWYRELAPSRDLRRWFAHDRARWSAFVQAYHAELARADGPLIEQLRAQAADTGLTLLFAARDTECNNAVALKAYLEGRGG